MRPAPAIAIATLLLAACSAGEGSATAPTIGPTATPSVRPVVLPPGVPPSYGGDVEPGDLPAERLVPAGATVTGTAFPGERTAIVTWSIGDDPFLREQGLVVWRRTPGSAPPWVATFALRDPPRAGVLGIRIDMADATGDGEADALVFGSVGGSGACGTWRLIALAPGADVVTYERDLCDATVEFSADPVGLRVTELVFEPGDPHCCPSRSKTTTLRWDGTRWRATAVERSDGP